MMKRTESLTITTPSDRELTISRTFNAPRALVYEAYTRPELVKRWLGVRNGWTLPVCEIDLRVGGAFRYVWRSATGQDMGMSGVFLEIVPGERVVATETFDDAWYEGDAVGTVTFTEENGRTTLTMTMRYASKDVRDAVLRSPMDKGLGESFDMLDDVLPGVA